MIRKGFEDLRGNLADRTAREILYSVSYGFISFYKVH